MKCRARILTLVASALAFACLVGLAATSYGAERRSDGAKSEKKTDASPDDLRKYDRNRNGKLDPDEEAAMRADEAKAKRERERKKG